MNHTLSQDMVARLNTVAEANHMTIEELLTSLLDTVNDQAPQRFFELTQDMLCIANSDGYFIHLNEAFVKALGYNRAVLLKTPFIRLVHPQDVEATLAVMSNLTAGQAVERFENRYRIADGSYKWFAWTSTPDIDGRIYAVARDITHRKHLEERLKASEKRYRGILESQIDLLCRYRPDTILTFVNDAYCRHFGKPREALIGTSLLSLTPPEMRPVIWQRIAQMLNRPAPDVYELYTQTAEGQKRWIEWVDHPITDDSGKVVEFQAVGRDITNYKQTQDDLKRQNEAFQAIFDSIPIMVDFLDADGNLLMINKATVDILGWTLQDLEAADDALALYYPDPEYRQEVIKSIQDRNGEWREFRTSTKYGTVIDTLWANIMLSDGRMIGIGQDITDRKQLEAEQLHRAQLELELQTERELAQLRARFMSMVSHEFRTPLTVIRSSAQMIERFYERLEQDQVIEILKRITGEVDHMIVQLQEVLTINRHRAGLLEFKPQPMDVMALCERIVEDFRLMDGGKHDLYLVTAPDAAHHIEGDPAMLNHVFGNLLSNALKYSPSGTTVTLSIQQEDDTLLVTVTDEGIGIPQEDQQRLFTEFYRADNAQDYDGSGLGLVIAKQHVEVHRGELWFESTEGQGATFYVRLPCILD